MDWTLGGGGKREAIESLSLPLIEISSSSQGLAGGRDLSS